jgi:hypothetical protein
MNIIATASQANTFTGNIRTYVPAASPAIISGTYGNESIPAVLAQAAACFNVMLAAVDAPGGPKQLTKPADGIFYGHHKPIF